MAIVIDISSDSEPEASPDKARRTTLEGFLPRKQKVGVSGGGSTKGVTPGLPPSRVADEERGTGVSSQNGQQRRLSSSLKQHERRPAQAAPAKLVALTNTPSGRSSLVPKVHTDAPPPVLLNDGQARSRNGQAHDAPDRPPVLEQLQPDAKVNQVDRVRKYEDFHTKEAIRRRSQPSATYKSAVFQNGIPGQYQRRQSQNQEPTQNGGHATRDMPKVPVLSGAGLSILDQPSQTQETPNTGFRQLKRPASSLHTPDISSHPAKRQRVAESLQRLPSTQQMHHQNGNGRPSDFAKESEQQLQAELYASLAPRSPQKPSDPCSSKGLHMPPPPNDNAAIATPVVASQQNGTPPSSHGVLFTPADDALLRKLKEVEKLSWNQIATHFNGRTKGALQVRYTTKVKSRPSNSSQGVAELEPEKPPLKQPPAVEPALQPTETTNLYQASARRKKRGGGPSALDGFVSWSQVGKAVFEDPAPEVSGELDNVATATTEAGPLARQDRVHQSSMSRLLRHRELGSFGGRGWAASHNGVSEEFKNHIFDDYRPSKHFMSTCGDVTCSTWAPDGRRFAASSIAISDDRSMQYNSGLNLLIGDSEVGLLRELPEHHISRPMIDAETGNVNGLHAMRESQDPRLFMTVAGVAFSPNSKRLYSAGSDRKVRAYRVGDDIQETRCRYEIDHPASVDLLSVSNHGLLATACHSSANGNVRVYECKRKSYSLKLSLSPSRTDSQSSLPLFPSALRWGTATQHSKYLLAGFSSDSIDELRDTAGETSLWDAQTGQRMDLSTVTRNVFDVTWNPSPSSASTAFAVASKSGTGKSYRGKQSIVQLYAPNQNRARQVLEWECPAFDINDVLYCPYDDSLIAAGATDGRVYIWDKRFANRSQKPLHILAHGDSVNVLDHDRECDQADTGVRFLSWGATASRLYSGSSDGVVKVWNTYRSTSGALVKDAATFHTAIMSGAFSPDNRDLLIGEECGRLNLLSISTESSEEDLGAFCKASKKFRLHSAPPPARPNVSPFAAAHDLVRSKQIEYRPMGALPIRQAVQGPRYAGPLLIPSNDEWTQAKRELDRALDAQQDADSRMDMSASQSSEINVAAKDAYNRVKSAQDALLRLHTRHDSALELELAAGGNQRALRRAEKVRMQLEASLSHPAENCKLDCNYLPKHEDSTVGVSDSLRSEQRIPAALRALPARTIDVTELGCPELYDSGLAGRCVYCATSAASPALSFRLKMLCKQRCASIRASFTGACEWCSAPVRGGDGGERSNLCERCAFACFRCAQPVQLLPDNGGGDATIFCENCDLAWRPGILGYELIGNDRKSQKENVRHDMESHVADDTELLYYHSRWQS